MTTRVHIVNLGPDAVEVYSYDPKHEISSINGLAGGMSYKGLLWPGYSQNEYVHDGQGIKILEKPKQ